MSCIAAFFLLAANLMDGGFTLRLRADFGKATADEPLYEAGPLCVGIRMAGKTKGLEHYDRHRGNYLSFPLPDGSCPVVEATFGKLRVGMPLGFLDRRGATHDVTVNLADTHLSIMVDGRVDDDMFKTETLEADLSKQKTLSKRVKSAKLSMPTVPDALAVVPDSCPVRGSIQYWTPPDHNAWVGDVAPFAHNGRLHVFYLYDRRHHASKMGTGGHCFAHLSSADLVHWEEHPVAVPVDKWWETLGTGTPFVKDGKLCLAYGLHTSRITKDGKYPIGGTYAVSDDGVHFRKTGVLVTDAQNPSIYNAPGGGFELVTSYGGTKGIFRSEDLLNWRLFDGNLPFRGDCPSLFSWHGHRYLLQGFTHMAYSADGAPGMFVDWTDEPDAAYDGLSVPMVVPWNDDRRIYVAWLCHPAGWGGWLVFRELVCYPDGHLGLKWVPEIAPPVEPQVFHMAAGERFSRRFMPEKSGAAVVLSVDPKTREARFADYALKPKLDVAHLAGNFKVGGLRCVDGAYDVRLVVWYDRKADATIFDAEIGGERTIIGRRSGRFYGDDAK